MIRNMTALQKKIHKAIKGHETAEVVHAFECLKLEIFLNKEFLEELE